MVPAETVTDSPPRAELPAQPAAPGPAPAPVGIPHILIVDDAPSIHKDFRKILAPTEHCALDAEEAALFGQADVHEGRENFLLASAYQGIEALALVEEALLRGIRYSLAFVDVRMPPGLDGVETTERLWKLDPDLQVVICTAYSDYSCAQMLERLGKSDRLVILKKPFDVMEVQQLANSLTEKWRLLQAARKKMDELEWLVAERTGHLRQTNSQLKNEVLRRQRREQALALQSAVTGVLADSISTTEEVTRSILQTIASRMEWNLGELWLVDRSNCSLRCATTWADDSGSAADFISSSRQLTFSAGTGLPGTVWKTAQPLWCQDLRLESSFLRSAQAAVAGLVSAFGFRLNLDRETLGVMLFFGSNVRPPEWEMIEVFTSLGGLIGQALERKRLEEQLRHSQKMDAIGYLAGGVAHDFNNILTVIQGYAQILKAKSNLDTETSDGLGQILLASERAANLTRQLLTFSRKQIMQCKPLDLNQVIASFTRMLTRIIGEDVALQVKCSASQATLQADEAMLSQVLMNLAVNARDAMPKGGSLTISTRNVCFGQNELNHHPDGRVGEFVCLTISDTGCGIAPEHLPHIFEPFFSTKQLGSGTGLGLSIAHSIVEQHQGWIQVASQLQAGTTFDIFLPCSAEIPVTGPMRTEESPLIGGSETILLVEDEEPVRCLAGGILKRHGYTVLEAGSGAEALAVWERRACEIDLLLTDIIMPEGISGRDLAHRLRARDPELKVVFTSGYSPEKADIEAELKQGMKFLHKPYKVRDLLSTLRASLSSVALIA